MFTRTSNWLSRDGKLQTGIGLLKLRSGMRVLCPSRHAPRIVEWRALRTALFNAQRGRCKDCNRILSLSRHPSRPLANLDHEHETMMVRGIVCGQCNHERARKDLLRELSFDTRIEGACIVSLWSQIVNVGLEA
jgi:hypothetical protein